MYEGAWERGLKTGEGVLHTGTGQIYEGRFESDMYHGPGILKGPGRDVLDGQWKRGKLNGVSPSIWNPVRNPCDT